jgi:hypothetical protein
VPDYMVGASMPIGGLKTGESYVLLSTWNDRKTIVFDPVKHQVYGVVGNVWKAGSEEFDPSLTALLIPRLNTDFGAILFKDGQPLHCAPFSEFNRWQEESQTAEKPQYEVKPNTALRMWEYSGEASVRVSFNYKYDIDLHDFIPRELFDKKSADVTMNLGVNLSRGEMGKMDFYAMDNRNWVEYIFPFLTMPATFTPLLHVRTGWALFQRSDYRMGLNSRLLRLIALEQASTEEALAYINSPAATEFVKELANSYLLYQLSSRLAKLITEKGKAALNGLWQNLGSEAGIVRALVGEAYTQMQTHKKAFNLSGVAALEPGFPRLREEPTLPPPRAQAFRPFVLPQAPVRQPVLKAVEARPHHSAEDIDLGLGGRVVEFVGGGI